MLDKITTAYNSGKKRIYAALSLFVPAVMVPGAVFAADGELVTAMKPGLTSMVADVVAGAALVGLVVLAVVGAKVIFNLMKKA